MDKVQQYSVNTSDMQRSRAAQSVPLSARKPTASTRKLCLVSAPVQRQRLAAARGQFASRLVDVRKEAVWARVPQHTQCVRLSHARLRFVALLAASAR